MVVTVVVVSGWALVLTDLVWLPLTMACVGIGGALLLRRRGAGSLWWAYGVCGGLACGEVFVFILHGADRYEIQDPLVVYGVIGIVLGLILAGVSAAVLEAPDLPGDDGSSNLLT